MKIRHEGNTTLVFANSDSDTFNLGRIHEKLTEAGFTPVTVFNNTPDGGPYLSNLDHDMLIYLLGEI